MLGKQCPNCELNSAISDMAKGIEQGILHITESIRKAQSIPGPLEIGNGAKAANGGCAVGDYKSAPANFVVIDLAWVERARDSDGPYREVATEISKGIQHILDVTTKLTPGVTGAEPRTSISLGNGCSSQDSIVAGEYLSAPPLHLVVDRAWLKCIIEGSRVIFQGSAPSVAT